MPGTIQVSVLDFKGLSSPSSSSALFIKVSMGKREYQTWDKGDFTFPLRTLRDSLIVTLQDAEGNEISHIGVQSMSIVEKGIWDDLFPLEGGGHVHLKLQFILSEDERSRIRDMRESASKKKQGKVLNNNLRNSEMSSAVWDPVASSSSINHEVSEAQARGEAKQAGTLSNLDTFPKDLQSTSGKEHEAKEAAPLSNSDTSPKDLQSTNGKQDGTVRKNPKATGSSRKEASSATVSSGTEVYQMSLAEKIDTQLTLSDVSASPKIPQDDSRILRDSGSVDIVKNKLALLKMENNPVSKHDKQGPPRKPPTGVRKMISAFETSLVQERRAPVLQVAAKSQSNKSRKEGSLQDQDSGHVTREAETISGSLEIPTKLSSGNPEKLAESSSLSPENPSSLSSVRLSDSVDLSAGGLKKQAKSRSGRIINQPQLNSERLRKQFLTGESQQNIDEDFGGINRSPSIKVWMDSSTSKGQGERTSASIQSVQKSELKNIKKEWESSLEPREVKVPSNIMKTGDFGDNKLSQVTSPVIESSVSKVQAEEADAGSNSEMNSYHNESNKEQDILSEVLLRSSTSKTTIISGQREEMTSSELQHSNIRTEQKSFSGASVIEGEVAEISSNNSSETKVASNDNLNLLVLKEDKHYRFESSGAWIFPHDSRHICITTGVTPVVDLYDDWHAAEKNNLMAPQNLEQRGSDAEMMRCENNSPQLRKTKPEISEDSAFTGAVKQAIKIAIVVGFGALVIFTRQREPRRSSTRKSNDLFFKKKTDYIDLQTSVKK